MKRSTFPMAGRHGSGSGSRLAVIYGPLQLVHVTLRFGKLVPTQDDAAVDRRGIEHDIYPMPSSCANATPIFDQAASASPPAVV